MSNDSTHGTQAPGVPDEVTFHIIKSNFFRVLHIDGVWGAFTPDGNLHISVYNERVAIPQKIVIGISQDGSTGDELRDRREGKDGYVREIEADLVMDIATARSFNSWLGAILRRYEDASHDE